MGPTVITVVYDGIDRCHFYQYKFTSGKLAERTHCEAPAVAKVLMQHGVERARCFSCAKRLQSYGRPVWLI